MGLGFAPGEARFSSQCKCSATNWKGVINGVAGFIGKFDSINLRNV